MQKVKLAIFDFDGTIAKLDIDWLHYRKKLRKILNEKYKMDLTNGLRVDQMELIALKKIGPHIHPILIKLRQEYESKPLQNLQKNDNLIELIKDLHKKKVILAICSNNLCETVESVLVYLKINDLFDFITGMENVPYPKPDTSGYIKILNKFNVSEKDTISIGDSLEIDKRTAETLGIKFLYITDFSQKISL